MSTVFVNAVAKTLKRTLDKIVDDPMDNLKSRMVMPRIFDETTMEDNYEDDVEYGGGGLLAEKTEGTESTTLSMSEGYTTRYHSKTYAARMLITEEAVEDCKYKEVIDLARRLKRSGFKTVDYDATLVFVRATNTAYPGGDTLPLASASHTTASGTTFSNTMATPMSPSPQAVATARAAVAQMVGHDGLIEGYDLKKVTFPVAQWDTWVRILKSKMSPEFGNYAAVNAINSELDIEPVENRFWQNTTTNYAFITDVDNGFRWKWRRKFRGRSWVDNDNEVMKYSISARWDRKWTDPRCCYFVNA